MRFTNAMDCFDMGRALLFMVTYAGDGCPYAYHGGGVC